MKNLFDRNEHEALTSGDILPEGTLNDNIIRISDEILSNLLEYRREDPSFTFSLRTRDSAQSDEKRLESGFWFQGSNYIYIPLFKRGDKARRIKTIGFVITFDQEGKITDNYIQLSFKSNDFKEELDFYKSLAVELNIELNNDTKGQKSYPDPNKYLENLRDYITRVRNVLMHQLHVFELTDNYVIEESEFQKALKNTLQIRLKLGVNRNREENTISGEGLNRILFGPPGTGKTFNTINRSLEIIGENIKDKSREEIKSLFDKKMKEGQIVFTTFHQSMSYEDFIEGIKPLKPLVTDTFVKYDIEPGIFYRICDEAKSNFENSKTENKGKLNFDDAFEKFKEDWEKNPTMKFPLKTEGFEFTIIGFTNYSIQFKKASGGTSHTLSIATLRALYYGKEFNFKQGVGIYYPGVLNKVLSYRNQIPNDVILKNYVLIIDEINRGNVSQIFGELITLIEDDKRLGNAEALEVILPYSKEKFGVPSNLYIIGTMNTADRSVEALDAALRRRFSFEEMPPKPTLIATDGKLKAENGILGSNDLPLVLNTINRRIEKLLDKDHQIGHSYFMSVSNLGELKAAFQNKIIPLLQEYFFGDFGKIGLVLGKGFFEAVEKNEENLFAEFDDYDASEFSERPIYRIKDIAKMPEEDFNKAIYTLLK